MTWSLRCIGLLLLGLALAGCSASPPARANADPAAEPVALRLGVGFGSPSPLFMPIYVAAEQGYFAQQGVQVDVAHLGGSLFVQAATGGDIQMGAISTAAAIAGIARGAPLKIVAVVLDRPNWVVLARQGSTVRGPTDLKGKRVLITGFGGATHQMLAILADRYGWDLQNDVALAPVSSNEAQLAILERGEADALIVGRERALGLEARGIGTITFEFADVLPVWADYVLVARDDFIASHPEAVRRVLRGFYQGAEYLYTHPDDMDRRLREEYGQPAEITEQVRHHLKYTRDGSIDPQAMEVVVDTLLKVDALDTRPNVPDLYTTRFTPVTP